MVLIALVACAPSGSPTSGSPSFERPVVVASSRELDLGWVAEGDVATQELVLTNDGELPFGIDAYELEGPERTLGGGFSVDGPEPWSVVPPGGEAVFTITLAPEAARNEDVLWIVFFEDGATAWYDREHPRLAVRVGGSGVGLPVDDDGGLQVSGGIVPEHVGVEVGGRVPMDVRPHEPIVQEWQAKDGTGTFEPEASAPAVEWIAPDGVPDQSAWLQRLAWIGRDDDGNQQWAFTELTVWPEGMLREPVVLEEEP